jgi:PEP-CTERM motif
MKLQKLSLFGAMAGALLLTAAFAPKANAVTNELLYYWNFNGLTNNSPPPINSVTAATFGTHPLRDGAQLNNGPDNLFTGNGSGVGLTIDNSKGTLTNAFTGDVAGGALHLRANSNFTNQSCFSIGAMDFSGLAGLQGASISFAIDAMHNGQAAQHGFTGLQLGYSFTGAAASFTNFPGTTGTFTTLQTTQNAYVQYSANLPTAVLGQSSVYIEFCFSGATDASEAKSMNLDNIQVNAAVPEPSTYIGGLLGIGVLCWSQRRRLIQSLRLRRT